MEELPEGRSVVGNDDQLSQASSEGLQCLLVAEHVLAGLHDKSQTGIDVVRCLFLKRRKAKSNKFAWKVFHTAT